MRIALVTYSTKPRGGVVHTLALAEALADLGADVTVWSIGRGGDCGFFRAVHPAVRLRIVPFPEVPGEGVGPRILRSIALLRDAFAAEAPVYDIVHAQDCITANAVGPCVRTVHHLDTFTTPELAACHERAIRRPHTRVCVSEAVAAELRAGWGVEATVIPNGVAASRFAAAARPDAAPARAAWTRRLGRYVLAVGGIEPRKGTLDLVRAMGLVAARRPELGLVVAGGETLFDYRAYRAEVMGRAAELGVEPVVLGAVPHGDLPALVAAAAVFAFPSVKEGFGLAAMEALAAGTPVVVRDRPVFREVFGDAVRYSDDVAGLATQLVTAADTPDARRRTAGQALAARHTWHAAAQAHLRLYRATLSRDLRVEPGLFPDAPALPAAAS
ncbi:MAG TPA: MSMEG_0565 family glycosyltransferase [Mycobacteriales bacterium]|jgi:glycosyltransferase-like protein